MLIVTLNERCLLSRAHMASILALYLHAIDAKFNVFASFWAQTLKPLATENTVTFSSSLVGEGML